MAGVAIGVSSKVGQDEIDADETLWTFGRAIAAKSKVGKDETSMALKFGRAIAALSKVGKDFFNLKLAFGRAIAANSLIGQDEFILLSLLGKSVYPPSFEVFLLKNGQEEPLENNEIIRGDFHPINLAITGDRIASEINGSMNVSFVGKLDPKHPDEKALFRKTLQNGGVVFLGVRDVITYKGKSRAATYEIRLSPRDTDPLTGATWVYSDIQVDDGLPNGERYTYRQRFKVIEDTYRGVGGRYP